MRQVIRPQLLKCAMQRVVFSFAVTLVSLTANADTDRVVATLAEPLVASKDIVLDANIFRCQGSTCTLVSHSTGARSVDICHSLQRRVGAITAYVVEGKPFDAEKLEKCNAHK